MFLHDLQNVMNSVHSDVHHLDPPPPSLLSGQNCKLYYDSVFCATPTKWAQFHPHTRKG